jgi:hypothetical protein
MPRAVATAILLALGATVGACESAADKVWTKPGGTTEAAFAEARGACRAASARTPLDPISAGFGERFQACMERDGWRLIDRAAAPR